MEEDIIADPGLLRQVGLQPDYDWHSEHQAAFKAGCPYTKLDLEYYEEDWGLYSYPSERGHEERLPYHQHAAFDSTSTGRR
jgi:hypothetical protein